MTARADGPAPAIWLALARVSELRPVRPPAPAGQASRPDGRPAPVDLVGFSPSELERLTAITAPRRRAQFIAGRLLLRRLLQPLLPPARSVSITASDHGPPRLDGPDAGNPPLHLALSHSGDWVCAAAAPVAVGLDLETTEGRLRTRDWLALAQVAGSPLEQWALAALATPSEQGLRFLTLWTLKEAWFKQQSRPLDWALLPRLDTARVADGGPSNARVWQTGDCTLALTWPSDSHHADLPLRWLRTGPSGSASGPAPSPGIDPSLAGPPLAEQTAQPWCVSLLSLT